MQKRLLSISISIVLIVLLAFSSDLSAALKRVLSLPTSSIAVVCGLLVLNLLTVSFRLQRLLTHFGHRVSFPTAFKANASGLIASLLAINILGSVLGRFLALKKSRLSPALITFSTSYERFVLAAVSGSLAGLGALYLFGSSFVQEYLQTQPITLMAFSALVAILAVVATGTSSFERQVLSVFREPKKYIQVSEIAGISLISQVLNICTYSIFVLALGHDTPLLSLLGAAAVIGFAASLPISVNGWGVRELSALAVFGLLGIPGPDAIAVSLAVGALNTFLIVTLIPVVLRHGKQNMASTLQVEDDKQQDPGASTEVSFLTASAAPAETIDYQRILALLAGIFATILLFFQFPVLIANTPITLNFGDPIALFALSFICLFAISTRQLPFALSNQSKYFLAACLAAIAISLIISIYRFGPIPWAVGNRGVGTLVILGYFGCGALISSQFGQHGIRRLLHVSLLTASIVVIVHLAHRLAFSYGLITVPVPSNFEGFSANRNAFSFQLLVVFVLSSVFLGRKIAIYKHLFISILVIYTGALATASLTGIGTIIIFSIFVLLIYNRELSRTFSSVMLVGLLIYFTALYIPATLVNFIGGSEGAIVFAAPTYSQISNNERPYLSALVRFNN